MRRRRGPAAADDAAVIESSWREPEQFATLFDRHAPHIYRYLARRAGRQVADDLVAETFLAAFAKRDRYDLGHPDARPWLYGIATNLVGQHRRDQARQDRISAGGRRGRAGGSWSCRPGGRRCHGPGDAHAAGGGAGRAVGR